MAREVAPDRFVLVPDASRWNKLRLVWCALRVALALVRVRPDVVISTGAAPGYFAILLARFVGARGVWIDSIANAEELSMSGAKASRIATLTLTQWPDLGTPLPPRATDRTRGAVYHAGAVV